MVRDRWLILAVLFFARTSMGFQFQSIASLSPFLVRDLAIDYAQLGMLIGVFMLPGVAIALPGGVLGKRFGDKRIALWGLALMVVGGLVVGMSQAYETAVAGRIVSGIGAVLLNVLLAKMVADWFAGAGLVTAMALLLSSWPLGIGLALLTQGALAAAYSWPVALYATAAQCGIALVLIAAVYSGPPAPGAPEATAAVGRSVLFGLSTREFGLASLAGIVWTLYNVGYIIVVSFVPPLLVARGLSAAEAGAATSLASWTLIASVPLGGFLIERSGRPTAIVAVCLVAMGIAILALPFASSSPLVVIALIGLIAGPPAGAIMALPAEVLEVDNRGPGMGVFFTSYYAGMALLPPVAGLSRDLTGDPGAPLVFGSLLLFATAATLGLFRALQNRLPPARS